jgi:hypothetical protein
MSTFLALRDRADVPDSIAQSLTDLPFGSQAQVQTDQGRLSAFLAYAGYDRRVGTVKYALRVLNNTSAPARARLLIDVRGVQSDAYPRTFEIAPYSMRDDLVPVRYDKTGPFDRALVEVSTHDSAFTVEAPAPPPYRRPWTAWLAPAVIPLAAALAIDLCAPRVLAVAAPAKAVPGTTVRVPFQASGAGTVEYDFATRDGVQLAAGLAAHSGVLRLPIPSTGSGAPYTLHVRMRNLFASTERTATIAAAAVQRKAHAAPRFDGGAPGALIGDLSVAPSPVRAGNLVTVKYATQAQSGDVWLVGMDGRTWARAPLSVSGLTQLSVPQPAAGHDMRIVLHAQRGTSHAESSVALSVLPNDSSAAASPPPPPAQSTPPQPTVTLDSQVVSPGDSVVVRVSGTHGDVKITVMTAAGSTVEQGSVSAEDGAISITAPSVSSVTPFYVVATYTVGVSQQSIVRRLVVTPR